MPWPNENRVCSTCARFGLARCGHCGQDDAWDRAADKDRDKVKKAIEEARGRGEEDEDELKYIALEKAKNLKRELKERKDQVNGVFQAVGGVAAVAGGVAAFVPPAAPVAAVAGAFAAAVKLMEKIEGKDEGDIDRWCKNMVKEK